MLAGVKTTKRIRLDVPAALHAICATGKGRCWYCDRRLPRVEQALITSWDVQRIEGERVASIILVCPKCQAERTKANERESTLTLRVSNATV